MEFGFTDRQTAFRNEVKKFLDRELPSEYDLAVINPAEDRYRDDVWELQKSLARKFGEKGWLKLSWPAEYSGKDNDPFLYYILQEEIHYRGAPGWDGFTIGMLAPTLIRFGTEKQKEQHLVPIGKGEIFWCEGFSEPEAGSDLASIQTTAWEDGNNLIINGQKIWTSGAHRADWCFLLARTDPSSPKKHMGLSFLLLDMKTQGISVRQISDMGGGHNLCQVFFDDVKVSKDNILGQPNHGWEVAMVLLDFERGLDIGPISTMRRIYDILVNYARENDLLNNNSVRNRLIDIYIDVETATLLSYRAAWIASKRMTPTGEVSISKTFSYEAQKRAAGNAMTILGSYGQLTKGSELARLNGLIQRWYVETFAFTLFTGSSEIQRNIIATRALGLPRA
ncbi:MAG: hypothetical protein A2Z02_04345 [Chloroflexi bacterium RBG_16_48_7]|nr:MAG: hypothetical protein A2Z02_04345 [Chloroflexi bacterium RBG_16_48_7]